MQATLTAQAGELGIEVFGISNGASFASAAMGPGIAPGSIFVLSGQGLGPEELVVGATPYSTQLPNENGGTRVAFHNSETGTVFDALLIHTSYGQIAGIIPRAMPPGRYTATVSYQQQSDTSQPFLVIPVAPGVFTTSMMGFGPGVVQNFETPGATPLNRLTRPALPGGYLIVWGTGLGSFDGSHDAHLSDGSVEQDVWVEVGGVRIRPSYAGAAPGFPGLNQINVPLPAEDLTTGCYVPLRVIATGVPSNIVTVSLSETPGTCAHPLGLATETLRRLDEGGMVTLGEVDLRRTANFESQLIPGLSDEGTAFASAQFYRANAQGVFLHSGPQDPRQGCDLPGAAMGAISARWFDLSPPHAPFQAIDAGPSVVLTGPSGQTLELPRQQDTLGLTGSYHLPDSTPGDLLQAGHWRIKGPGGADLGAFEATVTMLPRLTPALPKIIRLNEPLEITWPVAGVDDRHTARIDLQVSVLLAEDEFNSTHGSLGVSCRAPAAEGRLTIPVDVLESLPSENEGFGSVHLGIDSQPVVFTAPGLDGGVTRAGVSEVRAVTVE